MRTYNRRHIVNILAECNIWSKHLNEKKEWGRNVTLYGGYCLHEPTKKQKFQAIFITVFMSTSKLLLWISCITFYCAVVLFPHNCLKLIFISCWLFMHLEKRHFCCNCQYSGYAVQVMRKEDKFSANHFLCFI